MTKSYVDFFLEVYQAVMKDYLMIYPSDRKDVERDMSRLQLLVQQRGFGVITLDLPALGKALDKSLSLGHLHLDGTPLCRRKSRSSRLPRLFWGFWNRVFEPCGLLRSDPDINSILFLRQLCYLGKKVRLDCSKNRVYDSVSEFFRLDRSLRDSSCDWSNDDLDFQGRSLSLTDHTVYPRSTPLEDLLGVNLEDTPRSAYPMLDSVQRTADAIFSLFGSFDPREGFAKHGPGAVSDLRRDKDSKYLFPTWPEKLSSVFPIDEWGYHSYSAWIDNLLGLSRKHMPSGHEPPSKLIAVPKTQKSPRLIAAEPTAHQYCQQNLRSWIEDRVSQTFLSRSISFRDQTHSGRAALKASRDQEHWTIDLSSASDCVSTWLAERLLRSNESLIRAVHSVRTRWISNDIDSKSPAHYRLKKLFTQGSAITFPLQTVFYYTICLGVLLHKRGLKVSYRNLKAVTGEVRIFGDDIIVPKDCGADTVRCLSYLGFKVNDSKTFGTGKFRESCGVEGYDGYDVTPAYVLSIPTALGPAAVASNIEVSNNFHRKGFWHVAALLKRIGERNPLSRVPVVGPAVGASGWTSFVGTDLSGFKTRENHNLQRTEVLVPMPMAKIKITPTEGNASLFQYFTENPAPDTKWVAGVRGRPATSLRRRWDPIMNYAS
ncbi:replicase [Caulobacter phage phiCb5]|uniref:RNA-directed RNA polymerase n=1 Tax=Caulobacter phage phiCb5 TaxID=767473 RepID=D7RIC3_9VIRU|nr:replicase [Caulobacter phage phiCb5]ADH83385.1 replicase [Caulobacter phage phiCb5]